MLQFCLDFAKFYHEINILKIILHKNTYPRDFVGKYIKKLLQRALMRKVIVSTVPKKDSMIVLPCLRKRSFQICTGINFGIKNNSHTAIFKLY